MPISLEVRMSQPWCFMKEIFNIFVQSHFFTAYRLHEDTSSNHWRNSGIKTYITICIQMKPPPHPAFTLHFLFQLQINYDRNLGNLIVHVLQARNLAPRDNDSYSDPFVKVYLLPGRGWVLRVFECLWKSGLCLPFCFCVSPPSLFMTLYWLFCAVWNWLTTYVCVREEDWTWWYKAVI